MERTIEITIMGKKQEMPIIQAIYWRMLQKAAEGDSRMILEVSKLRQDLVQELHLSKSDEMKSLDVAEKFFAEDHEGILNNKHKTHLNRLRKATREY